MNRTGTISFLVVILTSAFGAFSCTRNEPPPAAQTTATTAPSTAPATTAPPPATATTTTVSAVAPTAGAIASTDGERAGAHIDVVELKRSTGGTVTLKFVIGNSSARTFDTAGQYFGDSNLSKDNYRDVSGIHLLDPVNKKKYFVVTDADRSCVCSKDIADIPAGGRASLWAKFAAPPPEVTKVTIEIPHFQPMDDVPISQ